MDLAKGLRSLMVQLKAIVGGSPRGLQFALHEAFSATVLMIEVVEAVLVLALQRQMQLSCR